MAKTAGSVPFSRMPQKDGASAPGPVPNGPARQAAAGLRDIIDRRSFLRSAFGGSLGLAASLAWPVRLTAGLGSGGSGPAAAKAAGSAQPESNRKMAALLEKITREADPLKNPFRNKEQAAILSALKERTSDPRQLFQLRIAACS